VYFLVVFLELFHFYIAVLILSLLTFWWNTVFIIYRLLLFLYVIHSPTFFILSFTSYCAYFYTPLRDLTRLCNAIGNDPSKLLRCLMAPWELSLSFQTVFGSTFLPLQIKKKTKKQKQKNKKTKKNNSNNKKQRNRERLRKKPTVQFQTRETKASMSNPQPTLCPVPSQWLLCPAELSSLALCMHPLLSNSQTSTCDGHCLHWNRDMGSPEQLFSRVKNRTSKISSKISVKHFENSLRIAVTATEPAQCISFTKTRLNIPLALCFC